MLFRKKCLIIALIFFLDLSVYGQSYRGFQDEFNDIFRKARITLGPFRFYPLVQIRNIGYDTNTQFGDNATPDYTGTLSAEANVYLPFRNSLILSFQDSPEYNYYLRQRDRRIFTNSYAFSVKYLLFSRIVMFGRYHWDSHWRRFSSELGWQSRDMARGYDFGLFYETARKTYFGLTGTWNHQGYADIKTADGIIPLSASLTRFERSGYFEFYYQIFHDSFLFTKVGTTDYQFENPEAIGRDAHSFQVYTGIRFPLLGVVQGTLSLGYKKFIPRAADKKGFSGLVGDTSLDIRLGRIGIRLGYGRDTVFSYFSDISYVDNGYSAGLVFHLTQFLRLDCGFGYTKTEYPQPFVVDDGLGATRTILRRDRQFSFAPGFVIRIFRQNGIGVSWGSAQWTSTMPGIHRTRKSLNVFLTSQF